MIYKKYFWDSHIKKARFNPEDILSKVSRHKNPIKIFDETVNINSLKLNCFKRYGTKCVSCGLEASEIHLEMDPGANKNNNIKWFLNLYGFKDNWPMLFTIDHIIPVSKGGKRESIHNVQPMCWVCNEKKGNNILETKDV